MEMLLLQENIKKKKERKIYIYLKGKKSYNGGQKNLGLCEKALPSNSSVGL